MDANARFLWVQCEEESMAHCKLQGWRERDTAGLGECQALFSHKKWLGFFRLSAPLCLQTAL